MTTRLQFLGAAGTVTGSKYLLETASARLLVDCGLFQGYKQLRLRNWAEPPFDPASLSAVVLTHAHLDHTGYLPVLTKRGFRGRIYCTDATADLCRILLPDSARLAEEDAERANRHSYSKHKPALPLYTERDADTALHHLVTVPFGTEFEPAKGLKVKFAPAGHILGAATIRVFDGQQIIVFSGDLGRSNDAILRPPQKLDGPTFSSSSRRTEIACTTATTLRLNLVKSLAASAVAAASSSSRRSPSAAHRHCFGTSAA